MVRDVVGVAGFCPSNLGPGVRESFALNHVGNGIGWLANELAN